MKRGLQPIKLLLSPILLVSFSFLNYSHPKKLYTHCTVGGLQKHLFFCLLFNPTPAINEGT